MSVEYCTEILEASDIAAALVYKPLVHLRQHQDAFPDSIITSYLLNLQKCWESWDLIYCQWKP